MLITFWTLTFVVAYVYAGYPLLLMAVAAFARRGRDTDAADLPSATLVISAFNEEDVIAEKIRNSRELDYPDGLLEVIVVSDASDDDTDEIVRSMEDDSLRLLRMEQRGGKTLGLNAAAAAASGEILVFSDANAMYRPDAVRQLAGGFADPRVGAVIGESTYSSSDVSSDQNESLYWRYEIAIKRFETRAGSVVGGDGAIYAVRKDLYEDMRADALSDFINPLQIVRRGFRCIYEPRAVSVEEAASSFGKEFRRKIRIVNRAWRALWTMPELLNPFRYGWFSIKLVSHKLLRWLVPFFLAGLLVSNILLLDEGGFYVAFFALQAASYALAVVGYLMRRRSDVPALFSVPYYFCLVNIASAMGIVQSYQGRTYTTWNTARSD